jgi:hypothetical protein
MPKTAGKVNAAGEAMTPDTYELTYVKLRSNSGQTFNITDIVKEIVVNESLFNASLETELVISDAINFFETAKLSGNERIDIRIQRRETSGRKRHSIECYIANIQDLSKPKPGVQVYRLSCVSKHAYFNTFKRLHRSFKGGMGELVKNICEKDLDVKPHKVNQDTKGILKGIFPNMKPIDAIVWLSRNSTHNSSPFYFYETLKDGVIFESQEGLYSKGVYRKLVHKPFYKEVPGTEENFSDAFSRILKVSSELDTGKFIGISDGAYASTVKALDISTKEYTNIQFEYKSGKMSKMNSSKPFADSARFNDQPLTELSNSKVHHVSLNSKAFGEDATNYHGPIAESLSQKQAYHVNLGYMGQDIIISGDFNIAVGKIIHLDLGKSSDAKVLDDANSRKNMIDKLQSGSYLITEIAHVFAEDKYTLDIGVQKDSSSVNLG